MNVDQPWTRRLPRSNYPMPGEALAGYLVNLAYRLDLPPGEVVRRLGVKPPIRATLLDLAFAVTLPADSADHFAQAAGLTREQVHALTVDGLGPVLHMARPGKRLARSNYGQKWINPGRTRACPSCLREQAHPVWQVHWITPWSVACTKHRNLLIDRCPGCSRPIGDPGPNANRSLIPSVALPVTHPAACRAATAPRRTCGHRLDEVKADAATDDILQLQARLHAAITRGEPDDNQWLRDLRLLVVLLLNVGLPEALAGAYEPDAQRYALAQTTHTMGRHNSVPPHETRAAAGLLLAADTLLSSSPDSEQLSALNQAAVALGTSAWEQIKNKAGPSVPLAEALHRQKRSTTQPRRLAAYLPPVTGAGPENIPAYLPTDLFDRYFSDARQPSPTNSRRSRYKRPIRRYAPIAVTMHFAQTDATTAGRSLGYTDVLTAAACARASDAFRDLGDEPELFRRIALVADHYNRAPRINYRLRRAYFDPTWRISPNDWADLTNALARPNTPWAVRHVEYSAWIWALVTEGDALLAPMTRTQTGGRSSAGGTRLAHDYKRWGSRTLAYLDGLASHLAVSIDASATAA